MNSAKRTLVSFLWIVAISLPVCAQLDRVVAEVEGMDCLSCAPIIELEVRRLGGVDQIGISIEKKLVAVVYKEGEGSFNPKGLRAAIAKADVRVIRFHISARGRVQQDGEKQFFTVGKDRFLVVDSPKLPHASPVGVVGVVDDSTNPVQLKIDDFKPLEP